MVKECHRKCADAFCKVRALLYVVFGFYKKYFGFFVSSGFCRNVGQGFSPASRQVCMRDSILKGRPTELKTLCINLGNLYAKCQYGFSFA